MNESPDDLNRLQALLDSSYDAAGEHLLSIHTPDRRLTAEELTDRLTGMSLLVLATTTSDGRPITGAVDGVFHRGQFWFGSSPTSLRARHLAVRPQASVTHLPGEHLGVTAHGTTKRFGLADLDDDLSNTYTSIYGHGWREWAADGDLPYWRLDADRMFVFHLDLEDDGDADDA